MALAVSVDGSGSSTVSTLPYWSKDSVGTVEIVEELPSPEASVRYFSKFETGCAVELCSRLLAHT